jgi:rRNA maturation RNase YbeY
MTSVVVVNAHRRYRMQRRVVAAYVRRVLGTRQGRISVVFIDSRRCRALNKRFLHHDYVTDVITFPLETGKVLEAEVYVNLDRARQQARDYRVSFGEEVARLVIHGVLHLLGYDDRTPRKARLMTRVQEQHVRSWFPHSQRNDT